MNQSRGAAHPGESGRSVGATAPTVVRPMTRGMRAANVISRITHDQSGKRRLWAGPTGWIIGAAGAGFLGITALFGGLEPVEAQPIPTGDATTVVETSLFDVQVERVVVVDDGELIGVETASDEVALIVKLTLTNHSAEPVGAFELITTAEHLSWSTDRDPALGPIAQLIQINDWAPAPDRLVRPDNDSVLSVWLQPEVATTMAAVYIVSDDILESAEIEVTVNDLEFDYYEVVLDSASYFVEMGEKVAVITLPLDEATPPQEGEG